jgi:hypothetical protein
MQDRLRRHSRTSLYQTALFTQYCALVVLAQLADYVMADGPIVCRCPVFAKSLKSQVIEAQRHRNIRVNMQTEAAYAVRYVQIGLRPDLKEPIYQIYISDC